MKIVGADKVACGWPIRTTHGFPCACELENLQLQGDPIPLESIHVFRRKLHIKVDEAIEEESGTLLDLNDECEELKKYFSTIFRGAKI